MKAADIRIKTDDELKDQLLDLKKEALNLRFQNASSSQRFDLEIGRHS